MDTGDNKVQRFISFNLGERYYFAVLFFNPTRILIISASCTCIGQCPPESCAMIGYSQSGVVNSQSERRQGGTFQNADRENIYWQPIPLLLLTVLARNIDNLFICYLKIFSLNVSHLKNVDLIMRYVFIVLFTNNGFNVGRSVKCPLFIYLMRFWRC